MAAILRRLVRRNFGRLSPNSETKKKEEGDAERPGRVDVVVSRRRRKVAKLTNGRVCVCVCVCAFLLVFTGFYWVLLGFTGFYRVLPGFYRVVPSFTEFYWGTTGFK